MTVSPSRPVLEQPRRDVASLPLPPLLPGGFRESVRVLQSFQTEGLRLLAEGLPVSHLRFGPERLGPALSARVALVASAQGAHDVLAGADGGFDKHGPIHDDFRRLSPNIFNLAHAEWLPRKRALQPVFTRPRMGEYAAAMSGAVLEAADDWADRGRFDLQERATALTCEVLGRSLLGQPLGDRAELLTQGMEDMTALVLQRGLEAVKAPLWVPTRAVRRYRAAERRLTALCEEAFALARREPERAAPLVRRLLEATDPETGEPLSDEARVNDLIVFMLAGHDTTATTLTYALWQLGREPRWQDAVAAEAAALGRRALRPEDVAALPVTVRVLHEAMRLCPPAPSLPRMTMRDVEVDGFRVPAGWVVVVNCFSLHRDPAAWDDPERFDPDRFTAEVTATRSRWQYLPFGGGQRRCMGDHFAMLEATVALATLVRDLRFTSEGEFTIDFGFTTRAGGPVPVAVERRG